MKLKPELQQEPCNQQQSRVANGDTPESGAMPIARPPHDPRKGIATTYEGVRYRSRLEARWADMFVRLGCASFVPENGSWRCRRCGANDGAGHAGWFEQGDLDATWAASGNRVQWKPGSR